MELKKPQRLVSLDTLRGFDMLWITGGGAFVVYLSKASGAGWLNTIAEQMEHVPWEGFHFFDLIFPLFMFISGVAIPYAILSKKEKGTPENVLFKRIVKRLFLLIIFGVLYNKGLKNGFDNIRFASVLGQIGIAYFIAATIFLYTKNWTSRIIWLLLIMVFISVLQLAVPVPGGEAGVFTADGSINSWLDRMFLPGRLHGGTFDPEGLLCTV
jgi:predicted acyltransferase